MNDAEKLSAIRLALEEERVVDEITVSTHARLNLLGALHDMRQTGRADDVTLRTIERVCRQLAQIELILG